MTRTRQLWSHPLGAAVILVSLWLVLLALYYASEWGCETFWGPHVVPWWAEATRGTFENLQSEAWQVAVAAWVFKHFYWRGSPESKEPN
jgi:hypothetical protein